MITSPSGKISGHPGSNLALGVSASLEVIDEPCASRDLSYVLPSADFKGHVSDTAPTHVDQMDLATEVLRHSAGPVDRATSHAANVVSANEIVELGPEAGAEGGQMVRCRGVRGIAEMGGFWNSNGNLPWPAPERT